MPQAWSRLENRPLSRRMHREKCRPLVRLASGAPVFANGAVTAAMSYAFGSLASNSSDGSIQHDDEALPDGVTRGEVDPEGPLSYEEVRGSMREAWYASASGTRYAREQGGWIVRPQGVRGWLRRVFGRPEVYVVRAPSGTARAINLGTQPRDAIGMFHTHPMSDFPVGSYPADFYNRVPSYVIAQGGVTRINVDNSQHFLGRRRDVLR